MLIHVPLPTFVFIIIIIIIIIVIIRLRHLVAVQEQVYHGRKFDSIDQSKQAIALSDADYYSASVNVERSTAVCRGPERLTH